jgi:hypothetical protein
MRKVIVVGAALFLFISCNDKGGDSAPTDTTKTTSTGSTAALNANAKPSGTMPPPGAPAPSASAAATAPPQIHPTCNDIAQRSTCFQYANSDDAAMDHAKKFCASQPKMVFSVDGCPKENLIGVCVTGRIDHYRYSQGSMPVSAEKGKADCEGVGTWKPYP